jgi:uncharacterized protein YdaU (DUF1376 family)
VGAFSLGDITMGRDPAFLFYSKDWLTGTADMMPDEKGVYIDLLAHQHQKTVLPSDTMRLARMVALSHDDFLRIWEKIKNNFVQVDDHVVNQKLEQIIEERATNAKKKRIAGAFANFLRSKQPEKATYGAVKRAFSVDLFMEFPDSEITNEITKWYTTWLATR